MRNFKGTIAKGKVVEPPVAFIGGVAANDGAVRSLREAFALDDGQLFIPEYHASMGAVGAALIEADLEAARDRALAGLDTERLPAAAFPVTEPLSMERVVLLRDMAKPYVFSDAREVVDAYMGIDIGSVSTNLVVIDDEGEVIKEIYTKTDARPVEVVSKGLADIQSEIGARINLLGVGTTGSGRELVGELTGADIITDEITAHKTGADFIGRRIGKQCDTIFEIGGQDSKFISLQDGIVVDFAMNEACAAGTGSFLEEQAEKLGINIIGEFAELALGSPAPIRLGERCTVFMERDVMAYQQRGARRDDLVGGLAFSIATNYLNRLVRERHVGDVIFFQGGTAYNDSVAAAFSQILDKEIIVPPYNGVMGALGMALLARERVKRTGEPTTFRGWDLEQVDYTVVDFVCKACSNECDVRQFTIEGEKTYWGDKCSDRYRKPAKVDKEPVIADLVALREEALMAPYEAARARLPETAPTVGFARAMYTYDRLPFWATFFAELGLRPVLSPESDKQIREAGVALTVAEPCFPIRVAHGHVQWLFNEGVDWVFVPNQVNEETEFEQYNSHACPWGQTLPFVIKTAPGLQPHKHKILDPRVRFRDGREGLVRDFAGVAQKLGVSAAKLSGAFAAAYQAQDAFRDTLLAAGAEALERLELAGELGVVLVGRPYNMYDKGINMDIPRKLRKFYGVNVIPLDFLPIRGIDIDPIVPNMYWNYGRKILQTATFVRDKERLHLIYMTNFKCGPDSYIKHYVREASGKPFLTLQFDEHQNDAGAMTRCEAYLDSKGFLRWWSQDAADEARRVPRGGGRCRRVSRPATRPRARAARRTPHPAGDRRLRARGPPPVPAADALRRHLPAGGGHPLHRLRRLGHQRLRRAHARARRARHLRRRVLPAEDHARRLPAHHRGRGPRQRRLPHAVGQRPLPLRPVPAPHPRQVRRARLRRRAGHQHHLERRLLVHRRLLPGPHPHRLARGARPGHPHEAAAQDAPLRAREGRRGRGLPDRASRRSARRSAASASRTRSSWRAILPCHGARPRPLPRHPRGLRRHAAAHRRRRRDLLPPEHVLQLRPHPRGRGAGRGVLAVGHRRVGVVHRRRAAPPPHRRAPARQQGRRLPLPQEQDHAPRRARHVRARSTTTSSATRSRRTCATCSR